MWHLVQLHVFGLQGDTRSTWKRHTWGGGGTRTHSPVCAWKQSPTEPASLMKTTLCLVFLAKAHKEEEGEPASLTHVFLAEIEK